MKHVYVSPLAKQTFHGVMEALTEINVGCVFFFSNIAFSKWFISILSMIGLSLLTQSAVIHISDMKH